MGTGPLIVTGHIGAHKSEIDWSKLESVSFHHKIIYCCCTIDRSCCLFLKLDDIWWEDNSIFPISLGRGHTSPSRDKHRSHTFSLTFSLFTFVLELSKFSGLILSHHMARSVKSGKKTNSNFLKGSFFTVFDLTWQTDETEKQFFIVKLTIWKRKIMRHFWHGCTSLEKEKKEIEFFRGPLLLDLFASRKYVFFNVKYYIVRWSNTVLW